MFPAQVHRRLALELAAVFLVALVPRLIGIGQFLTADEKQWVGRGVEYVRALREFRFNDTLQTTHPGIPTLWVSGLSSAATSQTLQRPFTFTNLLSFAEASQRSLAVINSLLVVGIFLAARPLVTSPVALAGALTIALDPFLIAHSKIVHVDALLAGFTVLSLFLFLRAEQGGTRWALAGSAVAGALAMLSKLPGTILLPFAAMILFSRRAAWSRSERSSRIRLLGQWTVMLLAAILVLWPGLLWVPDPVGNVKTVQRDLRVALETPHNMEDVYALNPRHYLTTILARSTVPTLAGAVLFLWFLVTITRRSTRKGLRGVRQTHAESTSTVGSSERPSRRGQGPPPRLLVFPLHTAWMLVAFILLFLLGMTLGAKKGDRYLLPIFPVLDLLAAVGVTTLVMKMRPAWSTSRAALVAVSLITLPLAGELARLGPYALAHYNVIFPENLSQELGWGEGLDQVARFLNVRDDQKTAVASWYPEELRALARRPVLHLNAHEQLPIGYVVLYRNMFGRPPGHPANDFLDEYFRKQTPVFTAMVNGLPYAWVYRKPAYRDIVGELRPWKTLVAELPPSAKNLGGIEVLLATYSGRARTGSLVAKVRDAVDGPDLRVARYLVRSEDDNRWVRFTFDRPLLGKEQRPLVVVLTVEGTRDDPAPTVRFAPAYRGAPPFAVTAQDPVPKDILQSVGDRGLLGLRALQESP